MADVEHPATGKTGKPAGSGASLWLILFALLCMGAAVWLLLGRRTDSSPQANAASPAESTLHLDTFVLNVGSAEQRAYLRAGLDLRLNQEARQTEKEIPVSQVRDVILGVLSEGHADDLLTPAGKTKLKQNVLRALQERIPQLGVQEVYFTEFLIQR